MSCSTLGLLWSNWFYSRIPNEIRAFDKSYKYCKRLGKSSLSLFSTQQLSVLECFLSCFSNKLQFIALKNIKLMHSIGSCVEHSVSMRKHFGLTPLVFFTIYLDNNIPLITQLINYYNFRQIILCLLRQNIEKKINP